MRVSERERESHLLGSMKDWFQDTLQISKSVDAQVCHLAFHSHGFNRLQIVNIVHDLQLVEFTDAEPAHTEGQIVRVSPSSVSHSRVLLNPRRG